MKTRILVPLLLVVSIKIYGQITTLGEPVKQEKTIEIPTYDSLANMNPCFPFPDSPHKKSYKHLIGQSVYIVENSNYSVQLEKEYYCRYKEKKNSINDKWGLEGHYMTIIDLEQYRKSVEESGRHPSWRNSILDIAFQDQNDSIVYFYEKVKYDDKIDNLNKKMVLVGHFEKMKQLYEGKDLVFVHDDKTDEDWIIPSNYQNGIFNLNTRERVLSIKKGTRFQCTGISIDDRSVDGTKRGAAYVNILDRVVILLHNNELGDFYCYATSQDMTDHFDKKIQARCKNYIFGKFLSPEDFEKKQKNDAIAAKKKKEADQAKAEEEQAKAKERKEREQQRIQILVDKYGQSNVNLARQGKVKVGWNKELCKEAWGEPREVNKTTTAYGVHEQWVYYGNRYLYFDNGVLTTIQE